ncbi:hypothetical protein F3Y22_tig00109983pilonHSYRG00056 [Hibiscus syriacus]|uniref:Uncharacterized protein n=1 Tax=Hibiscus syriacus TaxID=106335 RepID=A0A6A3BSU3_HIBSY|nr:hypothetical protein F3Y22_tig00109983pilonHSYRG00056 [Hibiscus syriacus]
MKRRAGCTIRTERGVQFVIKNPFEVGRDDDIGGRRWFVYFNKIDYIKDDFVILSAGVFGTTAILFKSRIRGLKLSEALGSGFSCNGNNVAYLAGSSGPLNAYGLDRKQLSNIPIRARPGPSIYSYYSSSLGFTIQSAVLPTAYPYILFKGITTFGWPTGYWFFHGVIDKLKHFIGSKSSQAMVLNEMGHDKSNGKITFNQEIDKIRFNPPHDPLLPRKRGCNASSDFSNGVCSSKGQIFNPEVPGLVHQGLYVCDASLIPCSAGVNPCLTIATAAEHVKHLTRGICTNAFSLPLLPVQEDGCDISCLQWSCDQSRWKLNEEKQPVLLLNGHSTESFFLPKEPNDLIRTLLAEGHEVWLLQSRLHVSHPSNNFTVDPIGRYDIPSGSKRLLEKIHEFHGSSAKVHVVAHCVGGLSIHIALLGGHISPTQIASLCCTNSSMFFKVTTLATVKMWLPLVLISMALLGENKILPMLETSKASLRHRLLIAIARWLPRYERCTCDECEREWRSVVVTPETTFLANKYVKMHQPGFRHERVVVDGYGHSDLLIGEESGKEVFPHILSHIRLSEERKML